MPISLDDCLGAAHQGDADTVTRYLAEGGDINAANPAGFTPLLVAIEGRRIELARKLLREGASAKAQLDGGFSALHILTKHLRNRPVNFSVTIERAGREVVLTDPDEIRKEIGRHPDDEYGAWLALAEELLKAGVDVDVAKEQTNQRVLRDAAEASPELVAMILEHAKPDVNHADKEGITALHLASRKGFTNAVELLLNAGANPNAADAYGFTPLHEAILSGQEAVAKQLLAAGADPKQKLTRAHPPHAAGDDAAAIARASSHQNLASLFS